MINMIKHLGLFLIFKIFQESSKEHNQHKNPDEQTEQWMTKKWPVYASLLTTSLAW